MKIMDLNQMDRKSRTFFVALFFIILISIGFTFYRYVFLKNYAIFTSENQVPTLFEIFNIEK